MDLHVAWLRTTTAVPRVEFVERRSQFDAISSWRDRFQRAFRRRLPYCLLERRPASSLCRKLVPPIEHTLSSSSPESSAVADEVAASSSSRIHYTSVTAYPPRYLYSLPITSAMRYAGIPMGYRTKPSSVVRLRGSLER